MQINPETFKKLRKKNGFSQQTLADATTKGVSKKTIARIESGKGGETRGSTVQELAKALRVKPEILAREPDSDVVKEAELQKHGLRQVKLVLDGETSLAYDLVEEQYGVETRQIIKAAPMLFTILAEMSLAERRRHAKEAKAALEAFEPRMVGFYTNTDDYLEADIADYDCSSFDIGMVVLLYGLDSSYGRRDLFRKYWGEMFEESVEGNSFSDFLKQLARELGPDNDAIDPEKIHFGSDTFFDHGPLFKKYRKSLTDGSARADYALSRGYTNIGKIPKELRSEDEDVTSERVKWLEAKVPDEDWENSFPFHLTTLLSSGKGEENV